MFFYTKSVRYPILAYHKMELVILIWAAKDTMKVFHFFFFFECDETNLRSLSCFCQQRNNVSTNHLAGCWPQCGLLAKKRQHNGYSDSYCWHAGLPSFPLIIPVIHMGILKCMNRDYCQGFNSDEIGLQSVFIPNINLHSNPRDF